MSIKDYQFWNPVLDIKALQGFPKYIADEIRDRVVSFELKDKRHLLDEITLVLNNYDGRLLDPTYLGLGMAFRVSYGYPGLMATRVMQCRKANGAARVGGLGNNSGPNTAAGGLLTLILKSQIWNMNFERAVSKYEGNLAERKDLLINNATVPDIVREIARRHGFRDSNLFIESMDGEPVIEDSSIPSKYSAAEWIAEQAKRREWTFAIDENGFHFHSSNYAPAVEANGIEQLSWFNGEPDVILWNIKGDINIPQGIQKVGLKDEGKYIENAAAKGNAVNYIKGKSTSGAAKAVSEYPTYYQYYASDSETEYATNMDYLPMNKPDKVSPTVTLNLGNPTKQSIESSSRFFEKSSKKWKLQIRLVGNPKISARKKILLKNFGPLIDGYWIIRECTHSIKANQVYITEIDEAVRDEKEYKPGNSIYFQIQGAKGDSVGVIRGVEQ